MTEAEIPEAENWMDILLKLLPDEKKEKGLYLPRIG